MSWITRTPQLGNMASMDIALWSFKICLVLKSPMTKLLSLIVRVHPDSSSRPHLAVFKEPAERHDSVREINEGQAVLPSSRINICSY